VRRASIVIVSVAVGLVVGVPTRADACDQLEHSVAFAVPPDGNMTLPIDGALLAVVDAPVGEVTVTLVRVADQTEIPIAHDTLRSRSGEQSRVLAAPLDPLEPDTAYEWRVDENFVQPFVTGSDSDTTAPDLGEPVVELIEEGVDEQCLGESEYRDYLISFPDASEPVGLVAGAGPDPDRPGAYVTGNEQAIVARLWDSGEDDEICFHPFGIDHGGNRVYGAVVCVEPPGAGGSTGGSSTGDGLPDDTGDSAPDDTGVSPPMTTTDPAPETSGPGSDTDPDGDTDSGGSAEPLTDRGCSCRASRPGRPALLGLLLLALGWIRLGRCAGSARDPRRAGRRTTPTA
jgi:hypothetical protein